MPRYRPAYRVDYLRVPCRPRARRYRPGSARSPGTTAAAAAVGAALVLGAGHAAVHAAAHHPAAVRAAPHHSTRHGTHYETAAARKAIAYARDQLGKPYEWGGTGPYGYDCSGLTMMAWRAAGVHIPRTSEDQWAALRHISRAQLRAGDLIFYAGGDGTVQSPGHVVMYIGHGRAIQAYATGTPVEISSLAGMDAGGLTGYARP